MLLVYFIPYIYLFLCYLAGVGYGTTRRRYGLRSRQGLGHRPRGLGLTLFAMFIATVPPAGGEP